MLSYTFRHENIGHTWSRLFCVLMIFRSKLIDLSYCNRFFKETELTILKSPLFTSAATIHRQGLIHQANGSWRIYLTYKWLIVSLIPNTFSSMALAHPVHPIGSRSRNKHLNLWVRLCDVFPLEDIGSGSEIRCQFVHIFYIMDASYFLNIFLM